LDIEQCDPPEVAKRALIAGITQVERVPTSTSRSTSTTGRAARIWALTTR